MIAGRDVNHLPAAKACLGLARKFQEQQQLVRTKPEIRWALESRSQSAGLLIAPESP